MNKIKQVILVDDNDTSNFYNQDVLEETEFFDEITVFSSGTDVIAYFKNLKSEKLELPKLVFLDIKMPDYDGFEVLEELEELEIDNFENVIICMLTTSTHKRDLEKFEKFDSAVEYLEKPLEIDKVNELVEKYLIK